MPLIKKNPRNEICYTKLSLLFIVRKKYIQWINVDIKLCNVVMSIAVHKPYVQFCCLVHAFSSQYAEYLYFLICQIIRYKLISRKKGKKRKRKIKSSRLIFLVSPRWLSLWRARFRVFFDLSIHPLISPKLYTFPVNPSSSSSLLFLTLSSSFRFLGFFLHIGVDSHLLAI